MTAAAGALAAGASLAPVAALAAADPAGAGDVVDPPQAVTSNMLAAANPIHFLCIEVLLTSDDWHCRMGGS
ncbi:MAG TPA: hypothetical protein VID95_00500 [Candidatus Limnocylindrales bacterium]